MTFFFRQGLFVSVNNIRLGAPFIEETVKPDIVCEWGTERINLCQYDTESEIVEALIEKMTLQEKIGQMTQSVWHKAAPPRWMPTSQSL
jgi:hypothetical protein